MDFNYILKKFFYSLITIIMVITINFFLFRVMPGNPVTMVSTTSNMSFEFSQKLNKLYGFDKPLPIQFAKYVRQLLLGDFGNSFRFKRPVLDILGERLMATLLLALCAQIIAIGLGVIMGAIAAANRGKKIDVFALAVILFVYAIPSFWLGMILISFFSVVLGWFPVSGMVIAGVDHATTLIYIKDLIRHLVLPSISMGLAIVGGYAMIMRGSLSDVLTEDYITTAKAKGCKRIDVVIKHALPNAMLPMVTIIAIRLGFAIGGALQTEIVFSWPGIGRLIYEALEARDYPILQGAFLIVSFCVILANFLADILYGYLDPRIKYE